MIIGRTLLLLTLWKIIICYGEIPQSDLNPPSERLKSANKRVLKAVEKGVARSGTAHAKKLPSRLKPFAAPKYYVPPATYPPPPAYPPSPPNRARPVHQVPPTPPARIYTPPQKKNAYNPNWPQPGYPPQPQNPNQQQYPVQQTQYPVPQLQYPAQQPQPAPAAPPSIIPQVPTETLSLLNPYFTANGLSPIGSYPFFPIYNPLNAMQPYPNINPISLQLQTVINTLRPAICFPYPPTRKTNKKGYIPTKSCVYMVVSEEPDSLIQ